MPIYAYRCASCGHARDVLQKLSDPVLTVCPACGAEAFSKQLTAAGFQLKGSGWYVTDFRNGGSGGAKPAAPASEPAGGAAPSSEGGASSGSSSATDSASASATPAAGGCGGSCACH